MKNILTLLLLFSLCVTAKAGSLITATITVTNTPSDGDTITINGSARTWKNTVATPSAQIAIGASIGANATNMFNQFSRAGFTTLTLGRSGTNGVTLRSAIDQAMTVSIAGTWGSYTLTTNSTSEGSQVQVPASSYATQSKATNILSQLTTDLETYSTNTFSETAALLANFINKSASQPIGNKLITNSTIEGGFIVGSVIWPATIDRANGTTNNAIYFSDSGGNQIFAIAPDDSGAPSLYEAPALTTELISANAASFSPSPESILNRSIADFRYPQLTGANSFSGTNTFAQITNSPIVNSTITGSTVSGTIGTLSSGTVDGTTITNGITKGPLYIRGNVNAERANHTALANGANAAVNLGTASARVKIKAGPTAAFSIAGIANGANGLEFILFNATGQNMTISHDSGTEPTPANRIYTNTGADIATTGDGIAYVWYDSEDSRWRATLLGQ